MDCWRQKNTVENISDLISIWYFCLFLSYTPCHNAPMATIMKNHAANLTLAAWCRNDFNQFPNVDRILVFVCSSSSSPSLVVMVVRVTLHVFFAILFQKSLTTTWPCLFNKEITQFCWQYSSWFRWQFIICAFVSFQRSQSIETLWVEERHRNF